MESSTAERIVDAPAKSSREHFLTSHRALGVCTRELARLSDDIIGRVAALSGATIEHKAVVRQSPDRCIVQLGPVALTLAWLRNSHESVATGQLLVIVWRGAVAPPRTYEPERPDKRPAPVPPTPLWEEVLAAAGDGEGEWAWRWSHPEAGRCSSAELAALCVDRLRLAYLDAGESPPEDQ